MNVRTVSLLASLANSSKKKELTNFQFGIQIILSKHFFEFCNNGENDTNAKAHDDRHKKKNIQTQVAK